MLEGKGSGQTDWEKGEGLSLGVRSLTPPRGGL